MTLRSVIPIFFALFLVVWAAAACGGGPRIDWQQDPLLREWCTVRWRTSESVGQYHQDVAARVEVELAWCVENAIEPPDRDERGDSFDPGVDPETISDLFSPLDPDELTWIAALRDEVASRRGLSLDTLPRIRVIHPETYRRLSCWYMLHPEEDAEPNARWEFDRLTGLIEADWTPGVLGHLRALRRIGWYDANEHEAVITLITTMPLPESVVSLISHELVHAMQDQLLDGALSREDDERSSDQRVARAWLVEGDAETIELAVNDPFRLKLASSRRWGPAATLGWKTAGVSIGDIALRGAAASAAYTSGQEYVEQLQANAGWDAVNEHLRGMPESSEQIRHPGKLAADEQPLAIEPLLRQRDWVLRLDKDDDVGVDTLGEQALADLIEFYTAATVEARAAAAGWGVDAFTVVQTVAGQRATTVLWQIAFDSEADLAQGVTGLREWLIALSAAQAVGSSDGRAAGWDGADGSIRVARAGGLAWVIASDDPQLADELTARVLLLDNPRVRRSLAVD